MTEKFVPHSPARRRKSRPPQEMLRRAAKLLFLVSLILFVLARILTFRLPNPENIVQEVKTNPVQIETENEPFIAEAKGIEYTIEPMAEYEISGLIVSQLTNGDFLDYFHDDWKDYLNTKDICVIWGENAQTDNYQEMKFRTKSWTCEYWYPNREVGSRFKPNQFSNNHLLTSSSRINQEIKKAKRGDQIRISGFLARYSHSNGEFKRGTSLTREDRGNGACEVIWVTNFEILAKNKPEWQLVNQITPWIMGLSFLGLIFLQKRR